MAVRVTNTTETTCLIKRNTQVADFSVVTSEQAKFIKPVDMAILSMVQEGDPDFTTYFKDFLRTNKPEHQSGTFWFPRAENPGKVEYHTPIQKRILKALYELKEKEKLNPKDKQSKN